MENPISDMVCCISRPTKATCPLKPFAQPDSIWFLCLLVCILSISTEVKSESKNFHEFNLPCSVLSLNSTVRGSSRPSCKYNRCFWKMAASGTRDAEILLLFVYLFSLEDSEKNKTMAGKKNVWGQFLLINLIALKQIFLFK